MRLSFTAKTPKWLGYSFLLCLLKKKGDHVAYHVHFLDHQKLLVAGHCKWLNEVFVSQQNEVIGECSGYYTQVGTKSNSSGFWWIRYCTKGMFSELFLIHSQLNLFGNSNNLSTDHIKN